MISYKNIISKILTTLPDTGFLKAGPNIKIIGQIYLVHNTAILINKRTERR